MNNYIRIDEVVDSISVTHKFDKKYLNFLNTSDIQNGEIVNVNIMPVEELKGQAKKTIKKDDILFSEIRPKNGRYAYVKIEDTDDYVVSTKLMVLRNKNKDVDNRYFYYYLTNQHMLNILQERAENRICSFPQITFELLAEYKIRVPLIAEQLSIAKTLSDLDKKIETNNKIIKELEQMAKELYDYWFVQFDFPDTNGKPYRSSGGKMVYNPYLKREIPEGWEIKTLLDIATYTNGIACQNNRPTNNKEKLRVIKIKEMHNGFSEETEYVASNIPEKVKVYNGDVLFSWSASLEVMLWGLGVGALNQHIFKVTSNTYPREYYYYQLLDYVEHFKKIAEARKTTMGHITQDHLEQSKIIVPQTDEIILQFQNATKPIFDKIIAIQKENIELVTLRDWLLPMLMNGQVTVQAKTIEETKKATSIINQSQQRNQRFELWLSNQGAAARGEIDKATLREIFNAMDENDK